MAPVIVWGMKRNEQGFLSEQDSNRKEIDLKAAVAELIAMSFFVFFGCGIACANGASDGETRLLVAFAFGMGILVLAYAVGKHSGGQINCAVTLSLALGGAVPWYQAILNVLMQLLGSLLGASMLCLVFPCEADLTGGLGSNAVAKAFSDMNALVGEAIGTFFLCYVVWEVAISPLSTIGQNDALAIGFAVFLAHLFLLPITGCSINPTRSFGPAIVSKIRSCPGSTDTALEDLWIFWVGPLLGGTLAAGLQVAMVKQAVKRQKLTSASSSGELDGEPTDVPTTEKNRIAV